MRGEIYSRFMYIICVVIIVGFGTHHFIIRGVIDERFDSLIARCCKERPATIADGGGEPPYFRTFRLRNNGALPTDEIKEVKVEVVVQDPATSVPPGTAIWEVIQPEDFVPPPPPVSPPIPPGGIWAPEDNNHPELLYGVRVSVKVGDDNDWLVAEVKDFGAHRDVEVDVLTETLLAIDPDGVPAEVFTVRLWVSYDFAGGPSVAYDDSNSP